ncbi:MAG TPA: phosphoribosyl-ATP diphosphatase [Candidatus Wunengus sp. YC60]|uniref:phosphoribosyl-ATP diphosphatase n=1 Tax=Candidatus Wunengus sp. YC60 TaxID=3367697 RepID=UPI0040261E23
MNLDELFTIIQDRKKKMPKDSYVASLFKKGDDRIIQKVGEEATEVVIAAKNIDRNRIIEEIADLWFHCLVLLSQKGISPNEIFQELDRRRK